jgi:hypothetical protein
MGFPIPWTISPPSPQTAPRVRVPGALGVRIGLAPHTLVSAPSHLPVWRPAFGELGSGLPGHYVAGGFPEFTRFFHCRFHSKVTCLMSPLL